MASLRTELASLQDEPNNKGLEGKRSSKWVNSPLKESIAEYTYEKGTDFNDNYDGKFQPHRNQSKNNGFDE